MVHRDICVTSENIGTDFFSALGQFFSSLGQIFWYIGTAFSYIGTDLQLIGLVHWDRSLGDWDSFFGTLGPIFGRLKLHQFLVRLDRSIEKVDNKRFKSILQQRHSDYLISSNSSGTHLARIWLKSRFFMEHFQAQWENSCFHEKRI